ncbi:target of Nesh-SH3-like isoform X2 [Scleropages formosus]|uniref:target of Nesh-SH3-like isoform X2 n=1 Tax=Scleropages formosus TaxID=113540 RepID=UPI000878E62B|nr:target of Nesh-SH3-like isoform X2 [Scleropages formosus]
MLLKLSIMILAGIVLIGCSSSQRPRVRRQSMKVRINATGDTIVLKFVRPNPDTKLEGYILGYGGAMFSKQFIQLPEDGVPYHAEMDAEPKYLVAVQPVPANDVKKQCTGKVNLEKPLHLVIGSVTPTSVLLSWGTLLRTPYEGNIMNDCLEDGQYTVRYKERDRNDWNYQACPTSDTVIENLKPNTPYEFGVRPEKEKETGVWSKPVIHNTNTDAKPLKKPFNPRAPNRKPGSLMVEPQRLFPPRPVIHKRNQTRLSPMVGKIPEPSRTSLVSPEIGLGTPSFPRPKTPQGPRLPLGNANNIVNVSSPSKDIPPALPQLLPIKPLPTSAALLPSHPRNGEKPWGRMLPKPHSPSVIGQSRRRYFLPAPASERVHSNSWGRNILKNLTSSMGSAAVVPARTQVSRGQDMNFPPRTSNFSQTSMKQGVNGERHRGPSFPKPIPSSRFLTGSPGQRPTNSKKTNLLAKPRGKGKTGTLNHTNIDFIVKPKLTPVTPKAVKEIKETTTTTPIANGSLFDVWDNSSVLSSFPASDVDVMGKKRYIAPHVRFWPGKKPDEPCSITNSLSYFPEEEIGEQNVTGPPRLSPSNLTVVTVEGCPSFVILDWEKTDNETKEYDVISTTKGPDGEEVSIVTTNQTHTAVENLKPESSYEFKVKPKNELGEGPATDPVSFSTESADPRVSDNLSGKNAIWTPYPFNADSYSECNGKQYVKRTWYRKFVGIQLCNSLRYKIYLSDSLSGKFYNIGDQTGHGEDHCQFVDSFLDGRTANQVYGDQLPLRAGYFRAIRQQPVSFGQIGGHSHITYVPWYECGVPIPGKW